MSISLNRFLQSLFDYTAIQRSRNYLTQIDQGSIDLSYTSDTATLSAVVEGGDYYHTKITYSTKSKQLIKSECSCPVGRNCKHGAALAQLFYNNFLENFSDNVVPLVKPNNPTTNTATSNIAATQALSWLNNLSTNLNAAPSTKKEVPSPFIYELQQEQQLSLTLYKVRRNKANEIREQKTYTNFDNIVLHRIAMPHAERHAFLPIYSHHYSQKKDTNYHSYYEPNLNISHLPLTDLQNLISHAECYWHDSKIPLSYSQTSYQLQLKWQQDTQQGEKLVATLQAKDQTSPIPDKFEVLYTHPLAYLDTEQCIIGQLECEYASHVIRQLLAMPNIPKALIPKVSEVLQSSPLTQHISQPNSLKNIEDIYGTLTPIIRFGGFNKIADYLFHQGLGLAEIYFDYIGGTIRATEKNSYFFGTDNGEIVRQHRDLSQEKQRVSQLQKLIPSLQWLEKNKSIQALTHNQEHALILAQNTDFIKNIIPTNKFAELGWQVEHLADSPFNVQLGHNINLSLTESSSQQDWFELGATIQDPQGNTFNLVDLLSRLIKSHPFLLDAASLEELQEDDFLSVYLGENQPALALLIKDIKPILLHLGHLLNQDSHGMDKYDAAQALALQHVLGMPWQNNERLQQFANKLKQGYSQQLPTPQGFVGELRPYQQQGLGWLQFLRDTEHGGILADDMGLGKTAQTLAHILLEKQAGHLQQKPALIIAPTSLMYNWLKEAQKFTPDLKVLVLQGANRHQDFDKIPQHDIVLSTYPLLARDEELLKQHQYHLLILDEAQNIKNPRAKAAQVVRQLDAKHRLCLTGTPMENHLGELWSLFYFLMPGFLSSQELFNKNYRHPIEKKGDNQLRQKLVNRIKPFMMRRLKTEVAKELPAKTTIEINVDMSESQSKLYEAVRVAMQANIQDIIAKQGFKRSQIAILDALLKLRQVCCHPSLLKLDKMPSDKASSAKLENLIEMVTEMVEEGRKILIFSQFTTMLQLIEDNLNSQKIAFVKLTGQTKKREEVINAFQTGQVPVFLISLKAGGVGLNLTAADTVIHYDPWWNPAAEDQASDRAWRIGQDKPVFVYKLITNQSIEEKIIALQKNKADLAASILSHDKEHQVKLSEEDVLQLFERF
ncbi:MAG TPA: DEAD/DEAH box helicase [Agitococcus sp.]|nr:DEAD/DEAH box helicase [Agitococcus sp.]